jgi:hypothetical protein
LATSDDAAGAPAGLPPDCKLEKRLVVKVCRRDHQAAVHTTGTLRDPVMLSTKIARLIELRNILIISPYDLGAMAGDFFAGHVTGPTRELDGLVRNITHTAPLGREDRYGFQSLAGTVRDLDGWCRQFRQFDCGPLENAVRKLRHHDPLLRRLQREFPVESARRVVDERRGT